jgi:hypothetical protein
MDSNDPGTLERGILLHLLAHRGHQVRFEADQWTTEFGIIRTFPMHDAAVVRQALRNLEMARCIYRRVQYVIGYSEPKLVYTLTPGGQRRAVESKERESGDPRPAPTSAPISSDLNRSFFNIRGVLTSDGRDIDV